MKTEARKSPLSVPASSIADQTTEPAPGELSLPPFARRTLLKGAAAGAALGTLGGLALPSSVASAAAVEPAHPATGQLREYWFQANSFLHNLVPTGIDGMMGTKYTPDQTSYWAVGYQAYTPGWGKLLSGNDDIGANNGIPGPIIRAQVGDTIRVHFRNNDTHYGFPHSIHPHGVFYTPENDGAWAFAFGDKPGTAVPVGGTFTYEWTAVSTSVGTWPYHDHSIPQDAGGGSPVMEIGAELGLFGIFAITDRNTPKVDKELFIFFHDLYQDDVPSLSQDYDAFNGFCFIGNTPTLHVKVGQHVRWRVAALGKEFHAFHLHGHRWVFNGRFDDDLVFGPAATLTFDYVEDDPGTWLYHCHVVDHMMGGMMGLYVAEP